MEKEIRISRTALKVMLAGLITGFTIGAVKNAQPEIRNENYGGFDQSPDRFVVINGEVFYSKIDGFDPRSYNDLKLYISK